MTCKKGHFKKKKKLFKENFKICSKNKRKLIKMTCSQRKKLTLLAKTLTYKIEDIV